ncbi:MAG: single-stranded DNA-binding protein [Jatrophihabitans sp.]|uniref:single-stranded DNA-binding protein n=1 Tax=Jatrophihabitans sp. TaxID=1932789 RepID=UPI003F7D2097
MTTTAAPTADNTIFLRGRLADLPVEKELPTGDVISSFRLTVARPKESRTGTTAGGVKVDSIDCAADRARVRKALARAAAGDVIEVEGWLQRRFWRGPAGLGSRYEVRVEQLRIVRRPVVTDAAPR